MSQTKLWLGLIIGAVTLMITCLPIKTDQREKEKEEEEEEWKELLSFWFSQEGSKLWFLSEGKERDEADAMIREKYEQLLSACERGEKDFWFLQGAQGALGLILVLDQLSRHIYRGNEEKIEKCGIKARDLLERSINRKDQNLLNGSELSFLLMPFRHEKPVRLDRLEQILQIVDLKERNCIIEKQVLSRFKRVTESRCSQARDDGAEGGRVYTEQDILEPFPVDIPESTDTKEQGLLYKVIEKYLERHSNEKYMIVSLSGGVDSMVLTSILHDIQSKKRNRYSNFHLVTAHVDYGNRGESSAEADFVKKFSESLHFPCTVHRIQGLLRGVTDREEYEEKSREIRFDLYKKIWYEELGLPKDTKPVVLFGHHEGDIVENVLSNALKGKTILELSGMTEESLISGCIIRRPLLPLTKDYIFEYSHRFKVPYFKDTTPRWSTRGQVRLEVLPCLERVYGKGFQHHLARLAEQSDEANELLTRDFFSNRIVSKNTEQNPILAYAFDFSEQVSTKPVFLWRMALRKAAHQHNILIATDKAVKFLYDSLTLKQASESKEGWFAELRKGSRGYVWENRYLLVFRDEPKMIVPYETSGQIELEPNGPVKIFGFWKVSLHELIGEEATTLPVVKMEDIWESFVVNSKPTIEFSYWILSSKTNVYSIYKSLQLIPSLQIDLQLRAALIPQVFPFEPDNRSSKRLIVKVELIRDKQ